MAELARPLSPTPDGDAAFCRTYLRRGSVGAVAALLALPADVRQPATVFLAFRRALGELAGRPGSARTAVALLEERVARVFADRPEEHPVDRAFAALVRERAFPRALIDLVVEGLAWDLEGRRPATYDALLRHCVRSGATTTVGLCLLLGRRDAPTVARACDLGIAARLVRIARDVGHDARAGRLHLPLEWLEEARVDVDRFVLHPAPTRGVRDVVLRLLRAAEPLDVRAEEGIAVLPERARPAARALRLSDAALAASIRHHAYDTVSRRVEVGRRETALLLARSLRPLPGELAPGPDRGALPAARPLVDAIAEAR